MNNVVALPVKAPSRLLSKKELGRELGRSPRWIEMRMREGMPVEPRRQPGEHARYDLGKVRAWLDQRAAQPATAKTLEQRVEILERQLRALTTDSDRKSA